MSAMTYINNRTVLYRGTMFSKHAVLLFIFLCGFNQGVLLDVRCVSFVFFNEIV